MNYRTRTFRIHDLSEFQAFQNSACPRRSRSHVRYTDRHKYCTHPRIKSLGCAVSRSRRAFAPKRQTVSHEGKSFRKGSKNHFTKDFGFTKTPRRSTAIRLFALFRVIAVVRLYCGLVVKARIEPSRLTHSLHILCGWVVTSIASSLTSWFPHYVCGARKPCWEDDHL